NDEKMVEKCGEAIFEILQKSPGGGLVFFSSYKIMEKIHKLWECRKTLNELRKHKTVFIEQKRRKDFLRDFEEYKKCANQGAVFLGVFRGKLSEGIDFGDNLARVVIIVGIPYPNLGDLNVKMKKQYNNAVVQQEGKGVDGNQWYAIQAMRAVNQAVGRVIRHKNDFGAIMLLDMRYNRPNNRKMMSGWIQKEIQNGKEGWNLELEKFFKGMGEQFKDVGDDTAMEEKKEESKDFENFGGEKVEPIEKEEDTEKKKKCNRKKTTTKKRSKVFNNGGDVFSNELILKAKQKQLQQEIKMAVKRIRIGQIEDTAPINAIPPKVEEFESTLHDKDGKNDIGEKAKEGKGNTENVDLKDTLKSGAKRVEVIADWMDWDENDIMLMTPTFERAKPVERVEKSKTIKTEGAENNTQNNQMEEEWESNGMSDLSGLDLNKLSFVKPSECKSKKVEQHMGNTKDNAVEISSTESSDEFVDVREYQTNVVKRSI
ncbi:HELICc2 domain containing protein, partial [Entamoeba invadens IP1]